METLRRNQKKILEITNTVKEMKSALAGLISRLDRAGERTSEHEEMSIETSQMKMEEEK